MAAVYKQEFVVTVYGTEPVSRERMAKELRTMEFTGEPVVVVDVGSGVIVLGHDNAVEDLVRKGGSHGQLVCLRDKVRAQDLEDAGGEEDEPVKPEGFAREEPIYSWNYDGPRWPYRADSVRALYDAPDFLRGSEQGHPGPVPFVVGDFTRKLTEEEAAEHGLVLVDWPGRIPDEEIEADYAFGGRKQTPGGYAPRTEDALRALIEHAIRTAPDELAGSIKTAWAVYKQRGVERFGQGTDSLPRLCDIIVFG